MDEGHVISLEYSTVDSTRIGWDHAKGEAGGGVSFSHPLVYHATVQWRNRLHTKQIDNLKPGGGGWANAPLNTPLGRVQ